MTLEFSEERVPDIAPPTGLHNPEIEENFIEHFNALITEYAPDAGRLEASSRGGYLDCRNVIDDQGSASIVPNGRLRETISLSLNGIRPEEARMILLSYAASLASTGVEIFIEVGKEMRPEEVDRNTHINEYILENRRVEMCTARLFVSSPDPEDELTTHMLQIEVTPYTPEDRDDLHVWEINHTRCENFRLPTIGELTDTQSLSVSNILIDDPKAGIAEYYYDYTKKGMQSRWTSNDTFERPAVYETFQVVSHGELIAMLSHGRNTLIMPPYYIDGGQIDPLYLS